MTTPASPLEPELRELYRYIKPDADREAFKLAIQQYTAKERMTELTELDNAYDEVTPGRFHGYYTRRVRQYRELQAQLYHTQEEQE